MGLLCLVGIPDLDKPDSNPLLYFCILLPIGTIAFASGSAFVAKWLMIGALKLFGDLVPTTFTISSIGSALYFFTVKALEVHANRLAEGKVHEFIDKLDK
jgi:hypothetical protein